MSTLQTLDRGLSVLDLVSRTPAGLSIAEIAHELGVQDRVQLVHSPLEDFTLDAPATLVINNISMHECRDIDQVTQNVRDALEPGGWFVISDFPFPDTDAGLRSVPGRIMNGIQFFEAQIDDQLLPRAAYDDLLGRHGFVDLGSVQLTPMHALTTYWRARGDQPRGAGANPGSRNSR